MAGRPGGDPEAITPWRSTAARVRSGAGPDGPLGRERSVVLSGLLAAVAGVGIVLAGSNITLMSSCIVLAWVGMAAWSPIRSLALTW